MECLILVKTKERTRLMLTGRMCKFILANLQQLIGRFPRSWHRVNRTRYGKAIVENEGMINIVRDHLQVTDAQGTSIKSALEIFNTGYSNTYHSKSELLKMPRIKKYLTDPNHTCITDHHTRLNFMRAVEQKKKAKKRLGNKAKDKGKENKLN